MCRARTDSTDSQNCLLTSEHFRFYFLVIFFPFLSFCFRAVD